MMGNQARRRELWLLLAIAVLGCLVRAGAVKVGLMSDDFMQQAMLDGIYPGGNYAPFDLYGFLRRDVMIEHVEQGTAPWWSVPELHGTVLRPLASLLLWLDRRVLPGRIDLWHLHSLLWFAAAIVAFGLAVLRMLPRSIAVLAVIMFACEAGIISPLAWLANRCVLMCATFGFLAIYAQLEWRQPRADTPAWLRERGAWVVGGLMTLSVAAGEYALGIVALLGCFELLRGPGPLRERARALLPAVLPVLVYLAVHKALGYGTFGAEVYADPFHAPLGYLEWTAKRIPKLITAGFWSIPGATINVFRFGLLRNTEDWWMPQPPTAEQFHRAHIGLAAVGVVLAAITIALARRAWSADERATLRVLMLGGVLGLLPIAVAPAHSRLLVIAQLAVCPVVAAVVVGCVRLVLARVAKPTVGSRVRGVVLVPIAALLAWQHTIGDLRWGRAYLRYLDALQASNMVAFTQGDLLDGPLEGLDVVVLNGPSQSVGLFGPFVLRTQGLPVPHSWRPLTIGSNFATVAHRSGPDTLVLSAVQGAWLHNAGELFFRREDQPLHAGDVLVYPTLRAEILADDDGHPTSVRFRFDRKLDDPSLLFVVATERGLMRWKLPPVGGRNVVPLPKLPAVAQAADIHASPSQNQ